MNNKIEPKFSIKKREVNYHYIMGHTFLELQNQVYGVIVESPNHKFLLVKGRKTQKWSFPKGHPYDDEDGVECAEREALEETGLRFSVDANRFLTLATGRYYMVFSKQELLSFTRDSREIMETGWFSHKDLQKMRVNIDVNTFLRRCGYSVTRPRPPKLCLEPETPSGWDSLLDSTLSL
jgi:predicted NUDIX family NTP pyrophosphohydrolase